MTPNLMTQKQVINWLTNLANVLAENKDYLTELDAAIGDADHGINMNRGFEKVREKLPTLADENIGNIFKTVSMTLISTVGGASGPLYGTFFLKGSAITPGKFTLTPSELGEVLHAGIEGVKQRGKANLEDKTMLDVLSPAVATYQQAIASNHTLRQALTKMLSVAETALKNTIPMIAKKGRASYLGERSIGHQDPGATSSYFLLKTLLETLRENHDS